MVQLPVELIDMILAELYALHEPNFQKCFFDRPLEVSDMDAQRGLSACTLVCRGWRLLATRYLFRDITCSFSYDLDDLEGAEPETYLNGEVVPGPLVGYSSSYPPIKTFERLYTFLADHPHICRLIRRLQLRAYAPYHLIHAGLNGQHPDNFVHDMPQEFLVDLLHTLPRIDSLDLVDINVTLDAPHSSVPSQRVDGVVPVIFERPLKLLSIRYSDEGQNASAAFSEHSIFDLLTSFGEVETLRIEPVFDYGFPRKPARLLTPMLLRPTNVEIGLGVELKPRALVGCLKRHTEVWSSIRRLHIDISSEDEDDNALFIRPVIPLMADTLEELTLQTHTRVRENCEPHRVPCNRKIADALHRPEPLLAHLTTDPQACRRLRTRPRGGDVH